MDYYTKQCSRFRILFLANCACNYFYNNIIYVGGIFMTSYALFLGASETQIGLLATIQPLTNILQLFSIYIYNRFKSRKKVICSLTAIRYLFFYLIILIPFIANGSSRIHLLVSLFLMGFMAQALIGGGTVIWNDFYVPNEVKGRYYSSRNILANITGIVGSLLIGTTLDRIGDKYISYVVIMAVMLIFSIMEIIFLLFIDDRNEDLYQEQKISIFAIISEPLKDKRYLSYNFFALLWSFATLLSSPFYNVYSIKNLGLSYSLIAVVGSITSLLKVFSAKIWGSTGDKKGWRSAAMLAGFGFSATTMMWSLFNASSILLYTFVVIINGLCMIGINIVIFNLNLELSSPEKRIIYFGFNSAIIGMFSFLAPNIGAYIINIMKGFNLSIMGSNISSYQVLFIISGSLQAVAILYLLNTIYKKESMPSLLSRLLLTLKKLFTKRKV